MKIITLTLSLLLNAMMPYAQDLLEVYPGPKGIDPSGNYQVEVINGQTYSSFVYYSTPLDNNADNAAKIRTEVIKGINENSTLLNFYNGGEKLTMDAEQSCSFTCFSFAGTVKVRITSLKYQSINRFEILPTAEGIQGTINGNQLTFELDKPQKLGIVINGDYLNPLFLFADAPEANLPDKAAVTTLVVRPGDNMDEVKGNAQNASVVWFEPGIHEIGVGFEVYSNQTIYLQGGAYLKGTLSGMMATHVTIRGRGVLSGDGISRKYVLGLKEERQKSNFERLHYHAINLLSEENRNSWNTYADYPGEGSDHLYIEGITIASPRQFFIRAHGVPITIQNVKMVGAWPYNTDGVSTIGQGRTTVFDCFFHCNDDAIYVSPNNVHIHHNIFWQGNNGCVFQFHWGGSPVNESGGYIHDCDVIHVGHVSQANNRTVFGSRRSGPGDMTDIYFKNICIEGPVWSLFRLATNGSGDIGSIEDITMENIQVNGPIIHPSLIESSKDREGKSSTSWIKNITLKNITINGREFTKDDVIIGDYQVKNVTIEN